MVAVHNHCEALYSQSRMGEARSARRRGGDWPKSPVGGRPPHWLWSRDCPLCNFSI